MSQPTTLLLLEDNPSDVRLIQRCLKNGSIPHYLLTTRSNLHAGLAYLQNHDINLILVNLDLPDSTGFQTFLKVHEQATTLPIIVISNSENNEVATQSLQAGAQDFLIKADLTPYLLLRAIRHAIERQSLLLELAQANQRLQKLDHIKSRFVHDVSHELRNPIGSLSLYLELLELGKSEKRQMYLTALKKQTQRLRLLVEDMLNLSRLEMTQGEMAFEEVNLNALVGNAVRLHTAVARKKGLSLSFEPGTDVPPMQGDYQQLTHIVTNLLDNAINYTAVGDIRVTTLYDTAVHEIIFSVQDTGPGIHADDLPFIFDRFFRGRGDWVEDVPGTGLGLKLVKEAVSLHNGRIEVNSHWGQGTTFRVFLPAQPAIPSPELPARLAS